MTGRARRPWRPPESLDQRTSRLLAVLAGLAFVTGYMGSVATTTITFSADQFGADTRAQGWALAAIRADVLIAVPLAVLADRFGRRRLLLLAAVAGPLGTALCALAPNLATLAALQILTRGFVTASATIIAIVLAEEMPARARTWGAGVLVAAAALGSAGTLALLPLADRSIGAWRLLYLAPLGALGFFPTVRRWLPETRRFESTVSGAPTPTRTRRPLSGTSAATADTAGSADTRKSRARIPQVYRSRLVVLATAYGLLALFTNPSRQFHNDFLRHERGFSAGRVSLYNLSTNAPGTFGLLVGGSLAERFGRRRLLAIGVVGGVLANVATLQSRGWALWVWAMIGAAIAGTALPTLAVYGAELFPTRIRGRASGITTFVSRIGAAVGLVVVGQLARGHHLQRGINWVAIAPLLGVALILAKSPETAGRELEDISP